MKEGIIQAAFAQGVREEPPLKRDLPEKDLFLTSISEPCSRKPLTSV